MFNDCIIISYYDSGYNYSIFYNGQIKSRWIIDNYVEKLGYIPEGDPFIEIRNIYDEYEFKYFHIKIFEKFIDINTIILCADGKIEIYKRG